VLRELWRSVTRALPIVVGVAGPIFVASLALLAWAGVLPMRAVALPWREGVPLWTAQSVLAAWPLWALRRRLLPEDWCVQLRCLPLGAGALWRSDFAVSAAILAPLGALYGVSVGAFVLHRPPWWIAAWPQAVLALAASWGVSCALGACALAWQRRGTLVHPPRTAHALPPQALLARHPGPVASLLWTPWWRGATAPGGWAVVGGLACALGLALAWVGGVAPVVPGAAWALMFCALLIALTERLQRATEAQLARLGPWLAALPSEIGWARRARVLVCLPMVVVGLAAVGLAVVERPWRAGPLAAFALGLVGTPAALTSVPASNREAHVALWAVCAGLLTAFGSELWD